MSGTISLSQKSCKHFGIPTDECTSSIPVVNSFITYFQSEELFQGDSFTCDQTFPISRSEFNQLNSLIVATKTIETS